MSTNHAIDLKDRFLMIGGRLSVAMIERMEREFIPPHVDRIRSIGNLSSEDEALIDRFLHRDRSLDCAVWSGLAYAELPLGTRFNALWPRESPSDVQQIKCSIGYSSLYLISGFMPIRSIAKGHRHVIFLDFVDGPKATIKTYEDWSEVESYGWEYGLSTIETASAYAANP